MPSALSVTEDSVPPVVESATVAPPVTTLLPKASLPWTVIVEVELPSAVIEAGEAVIVVAAALTAAGVTVRLEVAVWMPFVVFVAITVCGP